MQQSGSENKGVLFGDPGILASKIFVGEKIKKKYRLGIVPHYVDYDFAKSKFKPNSTILVINVRENPNKVALQIKQCENIASSSLHGLIFADSYRIPNIHLKFGDRLFGGLHKFNDYYGGMNAKSNHLNYSPTLTIEEIVAHCKLRYITNYLMEKQHQMIKILSENLSQVAQTK